MSVPHRGDSLFPSGQGHTAGLAHSRSFIKALSIGRLVVVLPRSSPAWPVRLLPSQAWCPRPAAAVAGFPAGPSQVSPVQFEKKPAGLNSPEPGCRLASAVYSMAHPDSQRWSRTGLSPLQCMGRSVRNVGLSHPPTHPQPQCPHLRNGFP